MRGLLTVSSVLSTTLALGFTSCQSATWDNEQALAAVKLEIQVDVQGNRVEIEYHVPPAVVPAVVQKAMNDIYPGGGGFTGAEVEWNGGVKFYELTKTVAGRDVEAMFYPDGRFYQGEDQVSSDKVPGHCKDALRERFPRGAGASWEEIRDSEKKLVEYHAKIESEGKKYKAVVTLEGTVTKIVREIVAEIEVPVPLVR